MLFCHWCAAAVITKTKIRQKDEGVEYEYGEPPLPAAISSIWPSSGVLLIALTTAAVIAAYITCTEAFITNINNMPTQNLDQQLHHRKYQQLYLPYAKDQAADNPTITPLQRHRRRVKSRQQAGVITIREGGLSPQGCRPKSNNIFDQFTPEYILHDDMGEQEMEMSDSPS